jgi:glycosyltransferase involved in cell wall biosynthesis
MPKVSVIIPNYNHARFLEQRIDSVLNQTFQDFEIIFLDDSSTDNTREIFAKYADHPKISHIVFNDINGNSTFKQWNKGIALATGEYIWIAESDDYAAPRFLSELVPVLDLNLNVGLTYCQSYLIDDTNQILSPEFLACTNCFDRKRWSSDYLNDGKNECENFLAGKNTIPNASAVLIRKSSYISEVGCSNEAFKVAGDWFTWSKILLAADIYFIAESLNYFRYYEGSVSRKSDKFLIIVKEGLTIFNQLQERVEISQKARKVFFELVSSWWLVYYVISENFSSQKGIDLCPDLLEISPDRASSLNFRWQVVTLPLKRFRYALQLGTRLYKWRMNINRSFKHLAALIKF